MSQDRQPFDPDYFFTAGQIAAKLQKSLRWFYRARDEMERLGFPKPVPMPGQDRWRGDSLNAWSRGLTAIEQAPPTGNVYDLAQIARARSKALFGQRRAS